MNDDPDVCFDAIAADVARRLADRWDVLSSGHIDAEIETTLLIEYVIGATIAIPRGISWLQPLGTRDGRRGGYEWPCRCGWRRDS